MRGSSMKALTTCPRRQIAAPAPGTAPFFEWITSPDTYDYCRRAGSAALGESALRCLGDPRLERGPERLAHRLELDPVEHVLEEAAHDQPLGLGPRQPARHQVEELLAVDLAERGAVGAAHVVRHDLEARDRVRVRLRREQQVAVLLVGVRLLRVLLDPDR